MCANKTEIKINKNYAQLLQVSEKGILCSIEPVR